MNWASAIKRHRTALVAIVATVAALIGGCGGTTPITRRLRNAAIALLRPAEAAARRLIVIAARGIAVSLRPSRPPVGLISGARPEAHFARVPAFRLFDRWKRFGPQLRRAAALGQPRIRSFWSGPQVPFSTLPPSASAVALPKPADPDAPVDATRLGLRLAALERALADLPGQARRLARRMARLAAQSDARPGAPIRSPLRPGRPPGHRCNPVRDVDLVLRECHALALDALSPNTS